GNKIHLSFERHGRMQGVFFDFGINYHKLGDYYQEFLQPRGARGIHDHVRMGLVPFIRNYRPDMVPEDLDLSGAPELEVAAVMVSHAHMDHMGHAALLACETPLVCSPTTAAVMKAMRDLGQGGFESECPYTNIRCSRSRDGRVLSSDRGKTFQGRDLVLTEDWQAGLEELWTRSSAKSKSIEGGGLLERGALDLEFEAFPVDHSIYGATAYAVRTEIGYVVYTGDLRAHGRQGERTWEFVERAASLDPVALVIEGTTTSRAEAGGTSEGSVRDVCLRDASVEKGLVVADFSARHFERLETFMSIAAETDRRLLVTAKDAYYLWALGCADGVDRLRGLGVYDALRASKDGAEAFARDLIPDALVDPREVAAEPGRYILAFSFHDMGNMLDIRPEGGTYLYSSSEAYSEEQVIDFRRLHQWVTRFGLKVKGFGMEVGQGELVPVFDRRYHASGHAPVEDLLAMVDGIGAGKIVPVHTEDPRPFLHAKEGEVVVPRPGQPIDL
ncbi:MAG: hypothetical protein MUE65_05035, partial [Methanomassiliicoccales archaeon]|nr:hypothetical protein [Methanomassiliicoccales archaeon]